MKKNLFILMVALFAVSLTYAQTSEWDGTNTPFENGDGSESDPFLIESAQHFAYLAYLVNEGIGADENNIIGANNFYKMTVNIDLKGSQTFQWTPIGFFNNSFNNFAFGGHFDGDGKTIANLYINTSGAIRCALFGFMNGGSLKNFSIVGNSSIFSASSNSAVAAHTSGNVTIENVHNSAKVTSAMGDAAGLVVYNEGTLIVNNCSNSGNISAMGYDAAPRAGGIVGYSNSIITINNCYNTGNIESVNYAGGILGFSYNFMDGSINQCYNTGNMSANCAGGILGRNGSGTINISYSYNKGNISSEWYAAGITGNVTGSTQSGTINVKNCYNVGAAKYAIAVSYTSVTNSYYLNTASQDNSCGGIAKTEAVMKSEEMVTLLGFPFLRDEEPFWNEGFPILFNLNYPASVKTIEVTDISQLKATLTGSFVAGSNNLISKGFEYKLSSETEYTQITISENNSSYTLTNLIPAKQYQFRAFLEIEESTMYGNYINFNTLPITVTTDEATEITSTSATLNGTTNLGDVTVIEKGFILTKPDDEETIEVNNDITDLIYNVIDLTPDKTYIYKIYCTTEFGTLFGEEKIFTTLSSSIEKTNNNFAIDVYPNPTKGELKIENGELKIEKVELFDVFGKKQIIILNSQFSTLNLIDLSHLPAGVYFIKISTEAGQVVKKIVKK